mgnify:FL=1
MHNGKVTPTEGYCTDTLFDYAMSWIAKKRETPFFCFISTPVTHKPHHGPKDLVQEMKSAGMEGNLELFAQVENLDANIGRLREKLDELGLRRNTIVIFASDQGMRDRGAPPGEGPFILGSNASDGKQYVPFMVWWEGIESRISEQLAGMIDFFPTILDLCNIEIPSYADGYSLKPLLTGDVEDFPQDRKLVIQCPRQRDAEKWKNASVKKKHWRLVGRDKLLNVSSDLGTTENVADEHPEVVKELRAEYEKFWDSLPPQEETLAHHILGGKGFSGTRLNAMGWYKGAQPWRQREIPNPGNGTWALKVVEPGTYRFDCRTYPEEADKPLNVSYAKLKIGNVVREKEVDPDARFVRFEIHLEAGEYDLKTWLGSGRKTHGAPFVNVNQLTP